MGPNAAFPVDQVEAGDLSIGYVDVGPPSGPAVLLLHGWPYDIHSYAAAAPMLAAEGYRVVVPHLRGYGSTRFLSEEAPRNGQQAALAVATRGEGLPQPADGACDVGRGCRGGFGGDGFCGHGGVLPDPRNTRS